MSRRTQIPPPNVPTGDDDLFPDLWIEFSSGEATLKLVGELDMSNTDRFREAIHAALSPEGVVMDLSELRFMDSAGLQVILGLTDKLESGSVVIRNPIPAVRKLFRITGVDRMPNLVIEERADSDLDLPEEDAG